MQLHLEHVHIHLLEDLVALRSDIPQHFQLEVFLDFLNHPLGQVNAVLESLVQDQRCHVLLDDLDLLAELGGNLIKCDELVRLDVVD